MRFWRKGMEEEMIKVQMEYKWKKPTTYGSKRTEAPERPRFSHISSANSWTTQPGARQTTWAMERPDPSCRQDQ